MVVISLKTLKMRQKFSTVFLPNPFFTKMKSMLLISCVYIKWYRHIKIVEDNLHIIGIFDGCLILLPFCQIFFRHANKLKHKNIFSVMSSFPLNTLKAIFSCVRVFKTKVRKERIYQDSSELNLDLAKQKSKGGFCFALGRKCSH